MSPPTPDHEPWRILAKYLEEFDVEEYLFGVMFVALDAVVRVKVSQAVLQAS